MRYCRAEYQLSHLKWQSEFSLPMLSQCHGLWDEDDMTESGTDKEESDDELSASHGRRASSDSLKSINLAASTESVHVSFPEQPTAVRRKRSGSSSQISDRSTSFSSNRSQRGIPGLETHPEVFHFSGACVLGTGESVRCYQGGRYCNVKRKCFEVRPKCKSWLSRMCHLGQSHCCSKCVFLLKLTKNCVQSCLA